MAVFDVFNGDADGICALHQLRLAEPKEAELITGVKREISLLERLGKTSGAEITVLDVSMDKNRAPLLQLLATCRVLYIDHHFAGDIPDSPNLTAHIDPSPDVCTSLIVDRLLAGRFRGWAVVAAFGDNLHPSAIRAAEQLGLTSGELAQLKELGELMNYNGYGRSVADLHLHPAELYRGLRGFTDPLAFCRDSAIVPLLRQGFASDMARARGVEPAEETEAGRFFVFPGEPWARRAAGVFINERTRERPDLAHALFTDNGDGTFMVSVRAPLERLSGADRLCRMFPTGGGRAGAAGINALPLERVDEFRKRFDEVFAK